MEDAGTLTPTELTKIFGVNPRTLTQWMSEGRFASVRTLGGPKRLDADAVAMLNNRHDVLMLERRAHGRATQSVA